MFKAKLKEPEISFATGRPIARLEITGGNYREWFSAQPDEAEYTVEIERNRNPRSREANSYFHVLCGKIADKMNISKAEVKNKMISLYGQPDLMEDGSLNYMTVREEIDVGKFEYLHLRPSTQVSVRGNDGKMYRTYTVMRGVGIKKNEKTYDTKEMSILIDGTISEAREIGLTEAEIMSTKEKQILKEVYGID